jgi:uncharacterized membrane protein YphA (DoxX/SURF4 family)
MNALEITLTICAVIVLVAIFGPGAVKRVDKVIDNGRQPRGDK